jgi:formate hydrogenlyase subunit 6/NADH:ubiquinone oxidoreductase subunit I
MNVEAFTTRILEEQQEKDAPFTKQTLPVLIVAFWIIFATLMCCKRCMDYCSTDAQDRRRYDAERDYRRGRRELQRASDRQAGRQHRNNDFVAPDPEMAEKRRKFLLKSFEENQVQVVSEPFFRLGYSVFDCFYS